MVTKTEIQRLRSLREKKAREAQGRFVIEGEKVVAELLAAKFPLEEIYATPSWPELAAHHAPPASTRRPSSGTTSQAAPVSPGKVNPSTPPPRLVVISDEEMARASHFPTPSTVLAVGRITRPSLTPGLLDRGLTLALDGVQDAGNVGTLLRVADWFGFDRVVLSPDCADLFHQKVINASMGSFARMRVYTAELGAVLASAKAPVLGCDLVGNNVHSLPPFRDAIVVIGSEGQGLSAAVKPSVTDYVTIPRRGGAESLNAGIAAAIVCDNLRRAQAAG